MKYRDVSDRSSSPDAHVTEGRRAVVAVGIDRYRSWPRLDNAVNDANGALAVFERLGFEQVVAPLTDEAATADAIRRLVTDDLATLHSDDSLVLFFAGHGHTRTRALQGGPVETGFLIPVDGDPADGHAATWLRLDTWLSDVARLPARHILVILDACHSGVALGSVIKWRDGGGRDASLDELRRRQSRRVITSALGGQRAMDSGPIHGHSLFTGCLIEALTGGLAQDGRREATGSELGVYVQRRVTSYTGAQQTPDFGTLELDHRGEIILPIAGGAGAEATVPIRPPGPDRGGSPRPYGPVHDVPTASGAPVTLHATPAGTPPGAPHATPPATPHATPPVKIIVRECRESWRPSLASLPMSVRAVIGSVAFIVLTALVAIQASDNGTGILFVLGCGALGLAIAAGRWISNVPTPLRWISATLLRGGWWTVLALGAILFGSLMTMLVRYQRDRECREEFVDSDVARRGDRAQIKLAAAKACRLLGREAEARAREAEISQTPLPSAALAQPAPPAAETHAGERPRQDAAPSSAVADPSHSAPPAAEAKAAEPAHQDAEQPAAFTAALADAQRQPDSPEGAEAAIASYRRAMQAGVLDRAQHAQFALRLRTHGRALQARRDYDGAICAFEEAKLRDPTLDVAADLAAVRAAESPSSRSRRPAGGSDDPDALVAVLRFGPTRSEDYLEYRNRRGCTVPGERAR
jgi:tetratricopeptide (TPR) repeat protein